MHRILLSCGLLIIATFIGTVFIGCAPTAESNEATPGQTPKALTKATFSPQETADVRIISVDFDPPINQDGYFTGFEQRTLMVAVDNHGKKTEGDVIVTLEIRGIEDQEPLLSQIQTVSSLASGEVKVLKFNTTAPIPNRPIYSVAVEVKPVSGETDLSNNEKKLRLHLIDP